MVPFYDFLPSMLLVIWFHMYKNICGALYTDKRTWVKILNLPLTKVISKFCSLTMNQFFKAVTWPTFLRGPLFQFLSPTIFYTLYRWKGKELHYWIRKEPHPLYVPNVFWIIYIYDKEVSGKKYVTVRQILC